MRYYQRTTKECAFNELPPVLLEAIRQHMQTESLGNIETPTQLCCQTTSKKLPQSFFANLKDRLLGVDPDDEHTTAVLLTPPWLIIAIHGDSRGTTVFSLRLNQIQFNEFNGTAQIEDQGLNITGLMQGPERSQFFLGLGTEPAAEKFKTRLRQAYEQA